MNTQKYIDQLGREVNISRRPLRIISLVPSQTELLHWLGLEEQVVGITKFCTHPTEWYRDKPRIGGTKNINRKKIEEIRPDLIITNKEENLKEDIEWLAERFPVWVSDVHDIPSAIQMIEEVGRIIGKKESSVQLSARIQEDFSALPSKQNLNKPSRVLYLIWNSPYMAAGKGTFIDSIIAHAGWKNVIDAERYPEISAQTIIELQPDQILLSSEPFPFGLKHQEEIQKIFRRSGSKDLPQIHLVDGRLFSWYGSALLETPRYIQNLMT